MSSSSPTADDASPMVRNPLEPSAPRSESRAWRSRVAPPFGASSPDAAATPTRLRTFSLSPVSRRTASDDGTITVAPLSERDSIFATTYETQDAHDVVGAALLVAGSDDSGRSDRLSDHGVAASSSEARAPLSVKPDFNRRSTLSDLLLASISHDTPKNLRAEGLSHGPHRNDSDLLKRVKNLEKRQHVTQESRGQPQIAYSLRMSAPVNKGKQREESDNVSGQVSLAPHANGQERKASGRNSSKASIKQSIEATLANDEPLANARSRKASHYLGLFKENAASEEQKKHADSLDSREHLPAASRERRQQLGSPRASYEVPTEDARPHSAGREGQTRNLQPSSDAEDTNVGSHSISSPHEQELSAGFRPNRIVEGGMLLEGQDRSIGSNQSIEWRSTTPSGGSIPLRLLEEIRSRHKQGSSSQKHRDAEGESGSAEKGHSQVEKQRGTEADQSSTSHSRDADIKVAGEEDDEEGDSDSDKEHISSATYFPHQAPSPDGSDEGLDIENVPKLDLEDDEFLTSQTISLDAAVNEPLSESQLTAKSLQSKSTIRAVQHTFERAGTQAKADTDVQAAYTSESSQSDTDESIEGVLLSDESPSLAAHNEKTEITPTSTPRASRSHLDPGVRPAPLGAVELKPYKHQVGGHTKVFSFSRQAICKQLNNRENEFYEVIERNHPEMLKFLPKYLGVLNVTYQKVARRKKKPDAREHEARTEQGFKGLKQDAAEPLSAETEGSIINGGSANRPHSAPRAISHSQHFETQDDTVPQVIYANNMHMIPMNLFPISSVQATQAQAPFSRNASFVPSYLQETSSQMQNLLYPDARWTSIPESPSWGATTVNTQFKDKVLREVFSPPIVHLRKRQGQPRRETGQHLRGHSHLPHLSYPEHADGVPLTRSLTPDITSNRDAFQIGTRTPPPRKTEAGQRNEDPKQGSKLTSPLTEASRTSIDNTSSNRSDSSEASHVDARVIGRRRSGGGLRRGQIDIDLNKRSEFKYYEDEDKVADGNGEPMFRIELLESGAASATSSHVSGKVHEQSSRGPGTKSGAPSDNSGTHELERSPTSILSTTPVNPLQAQQQPDKHVRHFLLLEDLTANMSRPCVLDLKMGTRQYGVEATKKKQMSQRQKCKTTTSQQLGVRVCGMQVWNASRKDYVFEDKYAGRDVKAGREFQNALVQFLHDGVSDASVARHIPSLLEKLSKLEKMILNLPGYRFYASSLLMLYDGAYGQAGDDVAKNPNTEKGTTTSSSIPSSIDIRLVDFANCVTAEDQLPDSTPCPPRDRYGVDRGYIRGLRSLRMYLQRIWREIEQKDWVERGEGEGMGVRMKGAGHSRDQPDSWQEGYVDPGDVSV